MVLNDTIDQSDLIHMYRTLHPKPAEYTLFSSAYGTFSRIDHMLGHKTSLNKFEWIEIMIYKVVFFPQTKWYETRNQLQKEE